ncbi:N-glycosylase/DNA lyase-like [Oppia nitens]|uniref:N-glycosylase/DNA lyase-like n=1 Tax=Oppia nitens TaxID=1686743 RepID=UPI0023DC22C4|nr:N-glycosylase/DNA lyase-like [Oppia nitens]
MIEGIIATTVRQLNLALTLTSGQSFRWKLYDDRWLGVIQNKFVVELIQLDHHIKYRIINDNVDDHHNRPKGNQHFFDQLISDYFRLDIDLNDLYYKWSKSDSNFAKISDKLIGIRIMRQTSEETLLSFMCSQNNNISRIDSMIGKMCQKFGQLLCQSKEYPEIYSMPSMTVLADKSAESTMRSLGFGYRSKFIHLTAKCIFNESNGCPKQWFQSLEEMAYEKARQELMRMPGIGAKVADCIALMGLGHLQAIPVDTHVYKVAVERYLPHLKTNKTLNHKSYKEIVDFFLTTFGPMAGWAQSVLFCSHLKQFQHLLN